MTLRSIRHAGWDEAFVFGEPGTIIPEGWSGQVWSRQTGDWAGWYCGIAFLHANFPDADFYVMFEDDIALCSNIRPYLERWLLRCPDLGAVSLYTPERHRCVQARLPVVTDESSWGWEIWGAQAVVFTRLSLRLFLGSPEALNHRDVSNGHKDSVLGMWAERSGLGLYYHTPSLVQHLGVKSVAGNESHRAVDYVGDDFDPIVWQYTPEIRRSPACIGHLL